MWLVLVPIIIFFLIVYWGVRLFGKLLQPIYKVIVGMLMKGGISKDSAEAIISLVVIVVLFAIIFC